ncbi:MAG TPA: hypothetical protein VMW40_07705 [Candidatus Bathyarchaeia archaeon]|nr:hypothetical protein [Candidatus Bathyarchaeia archaeon]
MKSEIKKAISSIEMTAILVILALALTSGIASATTHVVNQTAPACILPVTPTTQQSKQLYLQLVQAMK